MDTCISFMVSLVPCRKRDGRLRAYGDVPDPRLCAVYVVVDAQNKELTCFSGSIYAVQLVGQIDLGQFWGALSEEVTLSSWKPG